MDFFKKLFNGNNMKEEKIKDHVEFLERERQKIWNRITDLENKLTKAASESAIEAQAASKKASEYKNRSEEAKNLIQQKLETIDSLLTNIQTTHESFNELNTQISEFYQNSKENNDKIEAQFNSIEERKTLVEEQIAKVEALFTTKQAINDKITNLEALYNNGNDYYTKLETIYKATVNRKNEIDKLYLDIIGYEEENKETGKTTIIEGKKSELEKSYVKLKSELESTKEEILSFKKETSETYNNFLTDKENSYATSINKWQNEYSSVLNKIEGLLPNALTTGLSYAYSEKKEDEEVERINHSNTFKWAIFGLVAVSLIPTLFSIKYLNDGIALEKLILDMPRLVLSILPLYIPILWVAYSANRKMNLSKRLIEEYSHKEVLSKTFEGLSRQINSIEDEDVSSELMTKLLFNVLEVSSENPGKLISDYNKSDHPLMDALDKSVKLTNAMTRLTNIPGFSKLASALEKRSKNIVAREVDKVEAGLDIVSDKIN